LLIILNRHNIILVPSKKKVGVGSDIPLNFKTKYKCSYGGRSSESITDKKLYRKKKNKSIVRVDRSLLEE